MGMRDTGSLSSTFSLAFSKLENRNELHESTPSLELHQEASCLLTVATVHGTEGRLDDALRVAKAQLQTLRFIQS